MYKTLMALVVLVPTVTFAQTSGAVNTANGNLSGAINTPQFSSTAYEGALRGWGALYGGMGDYLQSLGAYENLHEEARRKAMDNWAYGVQIRATMKDEYWARYRLAHPDYVTREMKRLDGLERLAEMKKRRLDVESAAGIERQKPGFVWKGHRFSSYAEFKLSPVYDEFLRLRNARQAQQDFAAHVQRDRREAAVEFLRKQRFPAPVE